MDNPVAVWSWIFLVGFIGLFVAMGYVGMSKTKGADDFAVARGSYGPWVLGLAVVATVASGSTFLGMPGLAYSIGFPSLWYPILYPLGAYIGMIMVAKLIKTMGDRFGTRTIPEFVGQRYDSSFLRVGLTIVSFLLLFYITTQLVAAATLFQVMMGMPYIPALFLTAGVLLVYVVMGGSHADILTDAVQGFLMLLIAIAIAVMFFVGFGVGGGAAEVNAQAVESGGITGWDTWFAPGDPIYGSAVLVLLLFIAHLPFNIQPHLGNKFMALNNARQMRTFIMFCVVAGGILPMMALGGILGAAVLGDGLERADQVIPALFTDLFPPIVAAFLAVAIISAVLSTSDGLIISVSQLLANDLYRKTFARANQPEEIVDRNALVISRVGVALALAGGIALAWNPPEFLAVLLWVGIGGIVAGVTGPILIGSLWRRANKQGAIASFVGGVLCYAVVYLPFLPPTVFSPGDGGEGNPFAAAGVSVLVGAAIMVTVTLLTRPMPREFVESVFGSSSRRSGEGLD